MVVAKVIYSYLILVLDTIALAYGNYVVQYIQTCAFSLFQFS